MVVVVLYLFLYLFAVETYLEPPKSFKINKCTFELLSIPYGSTGNYLARKWRIFNFLSSSSWWNRLWRFCRSYRTLISSNVMCCDFSFYFDFPLFRHLLMIHLTIYIAVTIWSLRIVIPYSVFSGSFSYSQTPIGLNLLAKLIETIVLSNNCITIFFITSVTIRYCE